MATLITGGSLIQSSYGPRGAHNLEAVVLFPEPQPPGQSDWRFCFKCFLLFYGGFGLTGRCHAGGAHAFDPRSYNFVLPHDVAGPGQRDWRFCTKCFSLYFPGERSGWCPAGRGHAHDPASFNLLVPYADVSSSGSGTAQTDWRFCEQCLGLFYNGFPTKGVCRGGHPHRAYAASLNYVLPRQVSGFQLRHYWRDTPGLSDWKHSATIAHEVIGPAAMCQRPDDDRRPGNFEVIVPEHGGLAHYFRDNSTDPPNLWKRMAGFAATGATGPGSIVANRSNGHLELVAPHGRTLRHYFFDTAWRGGPAITTRASGPPVIIQSDYDNHLEVVVPEDDDLASYWFDGDRWHPAGTVTSLIHGPVGFVQGRYGPAAHPNFEVVVPRGDALFLYFRDNASAGFPWKEGGIATYGAGPVKAASMCSSDSGDGWLQVLTQEGDSVYSLYRHRYGDDGFRWMRSQCIRLHDTREADIDWTRARSRKLLQITGERDAKTGAATPSQSWSRSGIKGTDLGIVVEHNGRRFLLFGDTEWEANWGAANAIAEIRMDPARPIMVNFHGSPLRVLGGNTTDVEFDVPLDGFSLQGRFFLFCSSDHLADGKVMGRSVLARAFDPAMPIDPAVRDRPLDHLFLTTFSDHHFINVSVQLRPAGSVPGIATEGDVLLLWGTGAYRADDLRLAYIDLSPPVLAHLFGNEPFPIRQLRPRYFTGVHPEGMPTWSNVDDHARPLFWPSALGEISVRWAPVLNRYVMMAMSGPEDPMGNSVWLRTAPQPWGPWSRRRQVFDWMTDGKGVRDPDGQFIHNRDRPDIVKDCLFPAQCETPGAGYAPYIFDIGINPANGRVHLRYTLSTWNPYQVVMMEHVVTRAELASLERV